MIEIKEEFTLSVPMTMSDGDCIAYCRICCEVTVHGENGECRVHEKIDNKVTEADLLWLCFKPIETDNPLLGGYYYRNPKFRVKVDAFGRLFVSRPRWEGVESYWQEIKYDGREEFIRFMTLWLVD